MAADLERFIRRKTDSQSTKIEFILKGIPSGADILLDHIAQAAHASIDMVVRIAGQTTNILIEDGHLFKQGKTTRTNPRELRRGAMPQTGFTIHRKERSGTVTRKSRSSRRNSGDQ